MLSNVKRLYSGYIVPLITVYCPPALAITTPAHEIILLYNTFQTFSNFIKESYESPLAHVYMNSWCYSQLAMIRPLEKCSSAVFRIVLTGEP